MPEKISNYPQLSFLDKENISQKAAKRLNLDKESSKQEFNRRIRFLEAAQGIPYNKQNRSSRKSRKSRKSKKTRKTRGRK
jgi:hypothetical protein